MCNSCAVSLASFPGLPTVQFLIACSMQKWRGKPGPFYHVNDVSVYLRREGEESSIERTSLGPYLVVTASGAGVSNICEAKNVPLLVQNEESMHKMRMIPPLIGSAVLQQ